MEDRLYYKVLSNGLESPDMSSACQNTDMPREFRVFYKVGEFVKPNLEGSKLFIFEDEDDAIQFIERELFGSGADVWTCKVKNPVKPPEKRGLICMIKEYWIAYTKESLHSKPYPEGTLVCDEVMVLEKLA